MRRSTRLGLVTALLLLVLFGAYAAYWWIVAGRIEDGVVAWQQSIQARKIDASWRRLQVGGFPFRFRVELRDALLRDRALTPAPELRLTALAGSARPWNFGVWRLDAPEGLAADLPATGGRPQLKLAAQAGDGTVAPGPDGTTLLWLNLRDIRAEAGGSVPIQSAKAWVTLPPNPPQTHVEPSLGLAFDLRKVHLPASPAGFRNTIDAAAFGITVKGAVPDGPLVQAIAAWRDAGGTVELDNLRLDWGGVGVNANGTVALDQDLQPIGAFSGGIEGFAVILGALVEASRLDTEQAALAQIALNAFAKPGLDGKPQIKTSFTMQNGEMFLGPVKLGAAPRIVWK